MENKRETKTFRYWKYNWQKYAVLIAGIIQLLALRMAVQEYQLISRKSDLLFATAAQFLDWRAQMTFRCFAGSVCAALFFGTFLIGTLCSSAKVARLAEGGFLLVIALSCAIVGILFWLGGDTHSMPFCFLLAIAALGAGIYSFFRKMGEAV